MLIVSTMLTFGLKNRTIVGCENVITYYVLKDYPRFKTRDITFLCCIVKFKQSNRNRTLYDVLPQYGEWNEPHFLSWWYFDCRVGSNL